MTFRGRLRVFFAIIVIVPMVAIGVALLSITASSERGKTDAGLATALTVAFSAYDEGRVAARAQLRRVARDPELTAALGRGDRRAAARRLDEIAAGRGVVSVSVTQPASPLLRGGSLRGVAPARAQLNARSGGTLGTLSVSVTDARTLARTVRERSRQELLVLRGGRAVASTVPGVRTAPEGSGDFEAAGDEYRGRRERAAGAEEVVVFTDASEQNDSISQNRLLVIALLVAFLVLALASTLFVSRALQEQIGQFLEAARRLAGGRFDEPVPVVGDDEFAQLGREFNRMSGQLEAKIDEVERQRLELETAIRRVGEASTRGLDRQGVFALAVENAVQACEADAGHGAPLDGTMLEEVTLGTTGRELESALATAEQLARESQNTADREVPRTASAEGAHGIAISLKARLGTRGTAQHLGVIALARKERPFSAQESDLLDYLVAQAVTSIENADLHETVQRQAITDELTGLSNVRQMHGTLDREFERGRRFNTPVGFVLLDLDNFKGVNDTYGHLQGDEVLAEVASVLRELSRDIDEPARYGGEEMAVVLPQTEIVGAAQLAERMREAIADLRIPRLDGNGDLRVTASFGVASVPSSASDKDSLVAAADAALYRAKRAGKNRVERAETVTA